MAMPQELAWIRSLGKWSDDDKQPSRAKQTSSPATQLRKSAAKPENVSTFMKQSIALRALPPKKRKLFDVNKRSSATKRPKQVSFAEDEGVSKESEFDSQTTEDEGEGGCPPLGQGLRNFSNYLKSVFASHALPFGTSVDQVVSTADAVDDQVVSTADAVDDQVVSTAIEPEATTVPSFGGSSTGFQQCFISEFLKFLNTADKERLRKIRGIGEKRAKYIMELREESESGQPFENVDDLKHIGLSPKQIKRMLKTVVADMFNLLA